MALRIGDLSKVPPKQKLLLAVLACLLIGVGYYYGYYREASRRIETLRTQLDGLNSKIREQQVIAKNLGAFREEVLRLEERLALLLQQLPNSSEIPTLLKSITDLGRESGLEFLKFSPKGEVPKGFYAEIPVTIQVTGEFHGFALFTDRVSHLPRIVNLSDIGMAQPKRQPDGRYLVTVNCTATTFRFLEQAPAAGAKR